MSTTSKEIQLTQSQSDFRELKIQILFKGSNTLQLLTFDSLWLLNRVANIIDTNNNQTQGYIYLSYINDETKIMIGSSISNVQCLGIYGVK